jgi:hypothetical protein
MYSRRVSGRSLPRVAAEHRLFAAVRTRTVRDGARAEEQQTPSRERSRNIS